jgi:heme-degrading monooxygenase HmoA
MIEIVWEFVVKEEARGQFELIFGPGGKWSKLYAGSPGFRGTTLLRDENVLRRYLAIDLWDSEEHREQWLIENKDEYDDFKDAFADWLESVKELGIFKVLAEGTVRPRGSTRRRRY